MDEDEYVVEGFDHSACLPWTAYINYDEDAYCTGAGGLLGEFIGLDFEWFRRCAEARGWKFEMMPF